MSIHMYTIVGVGPFGPCRHAALKGKGYKGTLIYYFNFSTDTYFIEIRHHLKPLSKTVFKNNQKKMAYHFSPGPQGLVRQSGGAVVLG